MLSNQTNLGQIMSLSKRRVQTLEGSKFYGKPIGAVIGEGEEAVKKTSRPVTIERLKSLQRQFVIAKKANNSGLMKTIQQEFTEAAAEYTETHSEQALLDALRSGAPEINTSDNG